MLSSNDSGRIAPRLSLVVRFTFIKIKYRDILEALWVYAFAGFAKALALFRMAESQ